MAEARDYQNLRKPIKIGGAFIKNRIALAPMGDIHQFFDKVTGKVNRRWMDYMIERAKGGTGLLIPSVFKIANDVLPYAEKGLTDWMVFKRESIRDYAELAKCAHAFGATLFFQLSPGRGRVVIRNEAYDDKSFVPVSASDNEALFREDIKCRPLSVEEIERIVAAFGETAEVLANCGIDGIELHAHEGYLLDEFATALWNKRTDKYGGNPEKRMQLAKEILKTVKARAGKDFAVTYRYGVKHFIKAFGKSALRVGEKEIGRDVGDSVEIAKILESAGFDGLHVDVGCYESVYWAHPPMYMPHGYAIELTAKVKQAVNIPVIVAGRLDIPEIAERVVAEGKADMVALGRGLLADPYWPKKVFEGRIDTIKPCIGCHDIMLKSETDQFTTCAVNPFCANENVLSVEPAKKKKKILIAGAGVAGMEAALIASLRGHSVQLVEKTNTFGGHLIPAAVPDFKKDIRRLLDYYARSLERQRIEVTFNSLVTLEYVRDEDPDALIISTGSSPVVPDMPGADKSFVVSFIDLLLGKEKAQAEVVVVGGGLDGCETALWLAQQGKKVTVVEMLPQLVTDLHRANRTMLLDLLEDSGAKLLPNTKVKEVTNDGVRIADMKTGNESKIGCSTVVMAVGLAPNRQLYDALAADEKYREIYQIGDCKKARKISDATWEGTMVALDI
jgi:2-enoate reductase